MREEQLSIQEKERKEKKNESEQKKEKNKKEDKEDKNRKVSAFAKKKKEVESAWMAREQLLVLMYKDVYFTNNLNSSLPCEIVSLLQEFVDVFPEEIPD